MRRLLLGSAFILLSLDAQAGVLSCSFTEPFFNISFDSTTGVVTEISADETDPDAERHSNTSADSEPRLLRLECRPRLSYSD